MKQILRAHFGRGVGEDPILNDVWMTVQQKVRREHPKPEILHIAVSSDRLGELLTSVRLREAGYFGPGLDLLFGHPVYLDLDLDGDEAGYRVVHVR